jgi:hypothetical protein
LEEAFAEMPEGVKSFLREGFAVFSRLPEKSFTDVLAVVLDSIQSGSGVGENELASRLGLGREDARVLLASMTLLSTIIATREETAEQLVRLAANSKLIESNYVDSAITFFRAVVADRSSVKRSMERSSVASEVLPSLLDFETTVDLRLEFERGRVNESLPIALVHLDTDAQGGEVWLQLNKMQVEKIIKDLQETLRKMEEAERWASKDT